MKNRELGFASLGNGLSVYDCLHEKHSDYERVAHIRKDRSIEYYVELNEEDKLLIEKKAIHSDPYVSDLTVVWYREINYKICQSIINEGENMPTIQIRTKLSGDVIKSKRVECNTTALEKREMALQLVKGAKVGIREVYVTETAGCVTLDKYELN